MASTFHERKLQFSANCGWHLPALLAMYPQFANAGVDTYASMDPTYNGRNLEDAERTVAAMRSAEQQRGQASVGVGATLAPGTPWAQEHFGWNQSNFDTFVDAVARAGVVEISVFPAAMTNMSSAGVAEWMKAKLRQFLKGG